MLQHLNQLTNEHEAEQVLPWKVSDAPPDFTEQLLQLIIGIEIPITKLVGKWKVSQNCPDSDKSGDDESKEMADLVNQHISSTTEG